MKKDLFLFCFLVSALAANVQSKPHVNNQHVKHIPTPKEQSVKHHDSNDGVLPTFLPFESSTQDSEDEDKSEEIESLVELKHAGEEELEGSEEGEKNTPLLLSEEALSRLLQVPEEVDEPVEEDEDEDLEMKEEGKKDGESTVNNEDGTEKREGGNQAEDANETDSSTESEIPIDLDYAADRDASQPLPTKVEQAKASTIKKETEETTEDVIPTVTVDYDSQQSDTDPEDTAEEQDVPAEQTQDEPSQDSENDNEQEKNDQQDEKNSTESEDGVLSTGKKTEEKKKQKNEGNSHGKSKPKKQRNNQQLEKMQSDQASTIEATEERTHRKDTENLEEPTENTEPKTRKKNGKWSRLVGMNPVQIRAAMELYPDIRPTHRPTGEGLPDDPCENFRCKRGKTCKINNENKPACVCQEPSECPPSVNDFEHVCGTDNKTYDTSCQLFATKCGLEGTKVGHRLHLDYTGSCKFIPPCPESELVQFPLRMRDWLKNVLLQLYEHESMSPGFLTAKQNIRVQKIYESERRLHAGDHPVEILQQDFEKNYNMYIYPVHWQFAQMDQHPSDKFLSHSELAPLRVPLVPMEHCTSVFFQKCDADKDKLVSFKEWCSCFGIKEDDMDANLLF
ncbi:SPARC-like protein 1 [Puntigrus tetrazona]|uniref:SPARC-like protein 1 n=1 Tax=Puntigrus tetrazona TaxID=1606681 RepID=UPI001C8A418A|nr:SPARC-like protein 1 [Puntigrus tetrazona]XP_043093188.1 SPARC-like protein 1 [Puntigrus tetrazona]XP_043093195.1 SPARC-like protein 1 [Puntigrus tetrazona]